MVNVSDLNLTLHIKFAHEKRREGLNVSYIALLLHPKYLVIPEDQIPESKATVREWQH